MVAPNLERVVGLKSNPVASGALVVGKDFPSRNLVKYFDKLTGVDLGAVD